MCILPIDGSLDELDFEYIKDKGTKVVNDSSPSNRSVYSNEYSPCNNPL